MAEAKVRIVAVGAEQTKSAIQGVTNAARSASSAQTMLARQADGERARGVDQSTRAFLAGAQVVNRVLSGQLEWARRYARALEREGEQSSRAWARAWERSISETRRLLGASDGGGGAATAGARGGGGGGGLFAVGLTAATAATGFINRAQAVAGVRSIDERARGAIDFERILASITASTGVGADTLREQLLAGTRSTGRLPADVAGAVSNASDLYGGEVAAGLAENLDALGDVAIGSNASLEETIALVGQLAASFRVGRDGMRELIGGVASLAGSGRVPIGGLAGMTDTFATAAAVSGRTGVGAALETVALTEAVGATYDPGTTSATVRGLLELIQNNPDVVRRLRGVGVNVRDVNGDLRPMGDIAEELGSNTRLRNARTRERIFGTRSPALRALLALQADPAAARRMAESVDPTTGLGTYSEIASGFRSSAAGRFQAIGIEAEVAGIRSAGDLFAEMQGVTEGMTELEAQFPLLSEATGTLISTFQQLAGILGPFLASYAAVTSAGAGGAAAASAAATSAAGAAGGGLGFGGAGMMLFATGDTTGPILSRSASERAADVRRNLTPAALEALREATASGSTAWGRDYNTRLAAALGERGTGRGGEIISLSSETIRELASAVRASMPAEPTPAGSGVYTGTAGTVDRGRRGEGVAPR